MFRYNFCWNRIHHKLNNLKMADDKTKKGPADSSRVNVNEDYEVAYWTDAFDCTKQELIEAVEKVGTSSKAVKDYLSKS